MSGLTIKQEKFCSCYIECGNASEAYRRSYSCSGMKPETVNRKAKELLDNGKITARVKELQKRQERKSDITKEEVLRMLRNIMYADIRDFLSVEGGKIRFKDSKEWTDDMAMQVESVKQTKDGIELKLNGKAWSVQRICRMLGFDEPQVIEVASHAIGIDEAKKIVKELGL